METKLRKEGAVKTEEKLTSRSKKADFSEINFALSVLVVLHREGISFFSSGQKIGMKYRWQST
jgi:hypothetical protein